MTTPLTFGDCHTHLDQYDAAEMPGLLERAAEAGVASVILAGTTLESTRACIELAGQYDAFYAGVGIHPCQAYKRVDDAMYEELQRLAQMPKVVCVSEVGLDYLPESPDHAVQDQVLREHIRLAKSLDLPIIFHSREGALRLLPGAAGGAGRRRGRRDALLPGRRGDSAGGYRLRLLHFAGASADAAAGSTGSGAGHSAGEHRAGNRRISAAFQEVSP